MNSTYVFAQILAIGQKTKSDSHSLGRGFNCLVEVGVPWSPSMDRVRTQAQIQKVLARVDHKALGVDLDLGFEPTSGHLIKWLQTEITRVLAVEGVWIRWQRGDGYDWATGSRPNL